LLATAACLSAGAVASRGGSGGRGSESESENGSGDGARFEEARPSVPMHVVVEDGAPNLSRELAATPVTGTQPDEAVAAHASAQAVVETEREQPLPASEVLVAGDVAVQAAGEAGAGDVMPTSCGSAGVAQWPGEAPRVQNSRGSHDLLDQIRADDGEVEHGGEGGVVSE
ncbi:unnamed protein product, partial [Pylaiella littoralis]